MTNSTINNEDEMKKKQKGNLLLFSFIGIIFLINSFLLNWLEIGVFPAELAAMISAIILAIPIFRTVYRDFISKKNLMNELVALAIMACFIQQDFRMAAIISFFMIISRIIEESSAIGANESLQELIKLSPKQARKIVDNNEVEINSNELKINDLIIIRSGEVFPADGLIVKGLGSINEASITGESLPADKKNGDEVFAGTLNLNGVFEVKVSRVGDDTTLGKVKQLIVNAKNNKTSIGRLLDKYANYYTPIVLMIAMIVWFFTGDIGRIVAILIIACPYSLILATPSATVAALATAARNGILLKNVQQLELLPTIDTIIFDKTGTLTLGNLAVTSLNPAQGFDSSELLEVAMKAEIISNHPVSLAIRKLAEEVGLISEKNYNGNEFAGKGVQVKIDEDFYRAGKISWLRECEIEIAEDVEIIPKKSGLSTVFVAKNNQFLGWIGLSDQIRIDANETISQLKKEGLKQICMITGDNSSVANRVAATLGIEFIKSGCLPETKVDYVDNLKKSGAIVMMVGDGINDAPALAAGDSAIAMGVNGSEIAIDSASIALMSNDLLKIPFLLKLAKRNRNIILQNLGFGLFFILVGLYLSAMGILSPIIAAIIQVISLIIVLFNSARLIKMNS